MRCIPLLVALLTACAANENGNEDDDDAVGTLIASWEFEDDAQLPIDCPPDATDVKIAVTPEGDLEPLVQVTIPCDALSDTVVLDAGPYDLQLLLTDAAGDVLEVADPAVVSIEIPLDGGTVEQAWVFTIDP
jgi:hypothetical protein